MDMVTRLALTVILNHVEPGWDNCVNVVLRWLDKNQVNSTDKTNGAATVTVCAACKSRSCWEGNFFCEDYMNAGTIEISADDYIRRIRTEASDDAKECSCDPGGPIDELCVLHRCNTEASDGKG